MSAQPQPRRIEIEVPALHAAQQQIVNEAKRFNVLACGRRFGKALALDTLLSTPSGWTLMADVAPGDVLFDERGRQCRVTFVTDVMYGHECYDVMFSDGTVIKADADHQWLTWDRCARKNVKRNGRKPGAGTKKPIINENPKIRTTREIATSVEATVRGDRNHSIPCCAPLQMPDADLPIHPYLLGAWLGDGSSYGAQIFCDDPEIIEQIRAEGQPARRLAAAFTWSLSDGQRLGDPSKAKHTLNARLRALNLLQNKHIPSVYMRASAAQRLALLQGLMDTDGTAAAGHCEVTSVKESLARQVLELARSLGIRATLNIGTAKLNGRVIGSKYRITFSTDLLVFRLTRKAERAKRVSQERNIEHRFIVDVKPCESVPVRCIQVDSPSHLYLCSEAFIPTHNTLLGIQLDIYPALDGYPVAWFSPTYKYLNDAWRDMARIVKPICKRVAAQEHRLELITGGTIDMWSLDSPDSARGRKYKRVVVDEAAMVPNFQEAWQAAIRPTLTDYQGDGFWLSTPKGVNFFKQGFDNGQDPLEPEWMSWQMPTLANPCIPDLAREVESARRELPELTFKQEYLAEFLQSEGAVFRNVEVNLTAPKNSVPEDHYSHRVVSGLDWAQKHDFTAHSIGCVDCGIELELDRFNKIEWSFQRNRIKMAIERWRIKNVLAEHNSIGGPNIEALQAEGLPISSFETTAQSKSPLIQSLALTFEKQEFRFLNIPVATNELIAYESRVSPTTGRITYSAPEGMNDDTVIARALMRKASMDFGFHYLDDDLTYELSSFRGR